MKITKKLLLVFFGAVIGALLAIGIYFFTAGTESFDAYIEGVLIPNVFLALSTCFSLYIAFSPILTKLRRAQGGFDTASADIRERVERDIKSSRENEVYRAQIESCVASVKEMTEKVREATLRACESADRIERMVKIGFCNTQELVKNGYAKKIAQVGKNEKRET